MSKKQRDYIASVIGVSLDYIKAPVKPDPVELEQLVQEYREGSHELRDRLISFHYHLVVAHAGCYRYRRNKDDILGEALLALVDAVERAATALVDNNITPYVMSVVKDRIKDFLARDRVVHMPPRTFRHKVAKGEISREGNTAPAVVGVVCGVRLVESDTIVKEDSSGDFIRLNRHTPYIVPESPPEPSPEFKEALTLAIHTDLERRIIDLRAEGYKYRDMESILGLKRSRMCDHVNAVKERFLQMYVG